MRKLISKILLIIGVLSAVSLLLSYLSVHFSPQEIAILPFFGIAYPIILSINILFLIYYAIRWRKTSLIFLVVILTGFNHFFDYFSFNKIQHTHKKTIKVMSFNVRMFNRYKWIKEKNTGHKILKLIEKENPDILCIQEFYSNSKSFNFQDSILKTQNTKDYLISFKNKKGYSGNTIFSKFPIINKGFVNIGISNQKCIFADIVTEKDTLRIYSIHLASVHLNNKDYKTINNIENSNTKNIKGVSEIGVKMSGAYQARAREAEAINFHIENSPHKTIVLGDFNDTPVSYSYRTIRGELKDAFCESGFGIGNTYVNKFPIFRIDYILHDKNLESFNFKVIKKKLSDHYPIVCEIY